ncbi:MAG: SGNH/GDSL hydrolase family protein [Chloroflexota bacterium]
MATIITPYDSEIAVWVHKGQSVPEATIDQLAQKLRRTAPAVSQVFVKTSDGSDWMAKFDTKASMAIDGPAAIGRWVTTLQKYGLEFHAWCVPRGLNIDAEANVITQACKVPGVRSMILDVEPYANFWAGGKAGVRPLMTRIRAAIPGAFHIGMAVDPRPQHMATIFADEWFPFVNSVHLQLYWVTFGVTPEVALDQGYKAWAGYNRPLFPILEGYGTDAGSIDRARTLAINTYKSVGVSYWVYGQMQPGDFAAINRNMDGSVGAVPPGADGSTPTYGPTITVVGGGAGYSDGAYQGVAPALATFQTYQNTIGGIGKYHSTNDGVANVYARWDPQIKQSGWYTIEAFIPTTHATTGKARYKLHGVKNAPTEVITTLPQTYYNNEWAMIGTFQIDAAAKEAGVIYLNDWTFEPGLELAFDALRWRPVTGTSGGNTGIISNITPRAKEIFLKGKALGLRTNVFSKVGDSITFSPSFLTPIGQGQYDLAAYSAELLPVIQFFSQQTARVGNSFANPSLAAGPGWKADTLFLPAWSDPCGSEQCLLCEYNRVKPAVALIMIGTNDSSDVAPADYTKNLHRLLDTTINMGILPVISTIPPKRLDPVNNAKVDQWNTIIRGIAVEYQIPLWDYWSTMVNAPNQGISSDGVHPSAPANGATGSFTPANLVYGYNIRNLTALQVLNAIWKQVLS